MIALSAAADRLGWDDTQRRNHLADRRRARGGGFATVWSPVYEVYAVEAAPGAAAAERRAGERYQPPPGSRSS